MYELGYCTEIWYATMQKKTRWVQVAIPTLLQRQNMTLLQRQKMKLLQRWIMTSKKLSFSTNIQRQFLTLCQRLSNVNCLLGNQVIACLVNTAKLEQASWREEYMARLCRSKTSLIYSSVQIQGLNILFILLSLSTKSFKKSFNKQKWKLRAHNCAMS